MYKENEETAKPQTWAEKFGLTYTQVGDYLLPNIILKHEENCKELGVDLNAEFGKYGEMHKKFLKENKPALYGQLTNSEWLYPLCLEIDETVKNRLQLYKEQGLSLYEAERLIFEELVYNINA